jgi:predicted protein tyrosine phosphatase
LSLYREETTDRKKDCHKTSNTGGLVSPVMFKLILKCKICGKKIDDKNEHHLQIFDNDIQKERQGLVVQESQTLNICSEHRQQVLNFIKTLK